MVSRRKAARIALLLSFACLGLFAPLIGAADPASTLTVATFNIRIFSDRSRNDDELKKICSLLKKYDFIAIQEARDIDILDRTVRMLSDQFGTSYQYVASERVGRGSQKELYVFLYKTDTVRFLGTSSLVPDPVDYFIREPFYAFFESGGFDFYAINVHLLYGERKSDRLQEALLLDDVYRYVQSIDEENDVLLMGDFNLAPEDDFLGELRNEDGMTFVIESPTTIADRLYDNVWFQESHTGEFLEAGVYRFDEELFDDDDEAASLAVSDHRPLWVRFDTTYDDD
jgi:endonuclease/exonuclease/phosphatase family metal-dependent hydrolase